MGGKESERSSFLRGNGVNDERGNQAKARGEGELGLVLTRKNIGEETIMREEMGLKLKDWWCSLRKK